MKIEHLFVFCGALQILGLVLVVLVGRRILSRAWWSVLAVCGFAGLLQMFNPAATGIMVAAGAAAGGGFMFYSFCEIFDLEKEKHP